MPEVDSLFSEYQLLCWLPDETLFSLVSRHHQLWGHVTSAQTCQLIFGRARAGTHHDLEWLTPLRHRPPQSSYARCPHGKTTR